MRFIALSFYLALALTTLGGCGIKPSTVDAPASVEKDTYPKTYPDPATDPRPERYVNP